MHDMTRVVGDLGVCTGSNEGKKHHQHFLMGFTWRNRCTVSIYGEVGYTLTGYSSDQYICSRRLRFIVYIKIVLRRGSLHDC